MNQRSSSGIVGKTLLFVSLSALLLLLAAAPAWASGGRMPIYFAPVTITLPGSYYLAADLTGDLTIQVDHVTVDFMGHTLQQGNVVINNSTVRVHNGIVESHMVGKGIIQAGSAAGMISQVTVDNMRAHRIEFTNVQAGKISNCEVVGGGIDLTTTLRVDVLHNVVDAAIGVWGIHMTQCENSMISQNVVSNCGNAGIYLDQCHHNRIAGNTVSRNANGGITLSDSHYNQIDDNEVSGTTTSEVGPIAGIFLAGSVGNAITRNSVSGTYNGYGIRLSPISRENNVSHNTVSNNGRPAGILCAGIFVESNSNTIQWNTSSGSGTQGIEITGNTNAVDWNTTSGNVQFGIAALPPTASNVFSYNRSLGNGVNYAIAPANTIVDYNIGTPTGTNK